MNCGRCGEEFDEPVDGGCPGCGRKVVEAKPGVRRPPPARVYSEEGGSWTWRLLVLAAVAVLGGAGWFVYKKVTAAPPVAAPESKKLLTLKDWRDTIKPAQLIPAMDALKALLDQAESMPADDIPDAVKRVVQAANQTDARVMLLSALEGRKGRAAAGVLAALSHRLMFYQHFGDLEDLGYLQAITINSVLEHAGSGDADVRHGAAACLSMLSQPLKGVDGKTLWEIAAPQKAAARDACRHLQKDAKEETRALAEAALKVLN